VGYHHVSGADDLRWEDTSLAQFVEADAFRWRHEEESEDTRVVPDYNATVGFQHWVDGEDDQSISIHYCIAPLVPRKHTLEGETPFPRLPDAQPLIKLDNGSFVNRTTADGGGVPVTGCFWFACWLVNKGTETNGSYDEDPTHFGTRKPWISRKCNSPPTAEQCFSGCTGENGKMILTDVRLSGLGWDAEVTQGVKFDSDRFTPSDATLKFGVEFGEVKRGLQQAAVAFEDKWNVFVTRVPSTQARLVINIGEEPIRYLESGVGITVIAFIAAFAACCPMMPWCHLWLP
jgi:hypothetical protein